jgi:hypothetical protein
VLALAQRYGLVRREIDPEAAASVITATMEGIEHLWSVDRDLVDNAAFRSAWADAMDRHLLTGEGDMEGFQREATRLFLAEPD